MFTLILTSKIRLFHLSNIKINYNLMSASNFDLKKVKKFATAFES